MESVDQWNTNIPRGYFERNSDGTFTNNFQSIVSLLSYIESRNGYPDYVQQFIDFQNRFEANTRDEIRRWVNQRDNLLGRRQDLPDSLLERDIDGRFRYSDTDFHNELGRILRVDEQDERALLLADFQNEYGTNTHEGLRELLERRRNIFGIDEDLGGFFSRGLHISDPEEESEYGYYTRMDCEGETDSEDEY